MTAPVEIYLSDDVQAIGGVGNVLVSLTRYHQDMDRLRALRKAIATHFKRWPGGVATITVLEQTAYSTLLSKDERQEINQLAIDYVSRGVGLVIEGSGFRAAAVRAMLSAVYLVTRVTYPRKIFDRLHEASSWVTKSASAGAPGSVDAVDIENAVEVVRKAIRSA
jgi:hypothetical protein